MSCYRHSYTVCGLLTVILMGWDAGDVRPVWADKKTSPQPMKAAAVQTPAIQPKSSLAHKDLAISAKRGTDKQISEGRKRVSPKEQSIARVHRRAKRAARVKPRVVVTPKPDLSHHGMMEQPQRYSPHYEHGKGGPSNPNTGALLHDHFQELDKNRDGAIDPFERSLGRLDIDRDLADRQWQ